MESYFQVIVARAGIITPEMDLFAVSENIDVSIVREGLAYGTIIILVTKTVRPLIMLV